MSQLPEFVKQANLIIDGYGKLGTMENAQLPKMVEKSEDWRGGGMLGDIEIELGFEKMEFAFKVGGVDRQIIKLWGLKKNAIKPFQLLGHAFSEDTGETKSVAAYMRGRLKELEFDEWKAGGSPGMISGTVAMNYYRLVINDEEMIEYDPVNVVLKIGGEDQIADMRANLGL